MTSSEIKALQEIRFKPPDSSKMSGSGDVVHYLSELSHDIRRFIPLIDARPSNALMNIRYWQGRIDEMYAAKPQSQFSVVDACEILVRYVGYINRELDFMWLFEYPIPD